MACIQGELRSQVSLFPVSQDELIPKAQISRPLILRITTALTRHQRLGTVIGW